jgi:hypothetical protein
VQDARDARATAQVDVQAALDWRDFTVSGYSDNGQADWLGLGGGDGGDGGDEVVGTLVGHAVQGEQLVAGEAEQVGEVLDQAVFDQVLPSIGAYVALRSANGPVRTAATTSTLSVVGVSSAGGTVRARRQSRCAAASFSTALPRFAHRW